ncbi:hypothetical protein I8751_04790 [Nostocaceae cyanobacterium CENA357]|uniref:Uncharacterized protein n=1 Tax=Atlanticothrix silvestris CENA357 TaxID=1725252 RepID=A0A8J7L2F0_9CYAN|nr:hypothetical protein [Atlanticothrix silvestris]MBH8551702.1 hypothetical protein [Atlanticothrix silvestris CENA357]
MADLEKLVNELPKLIYSLNLTIGNSHEIMQQIALINHVQEQLHNIQKLIVQELRFAKIKNAAISTLPRISKADSLLIPSIDLEHITVNNRATFIIRNFGNLETKISLTDLQIKIDSWTEWGNLLQALAADILSDPQLVNQLNSNINDPSIPAKFTELNKILDHNLVSKNPINLKQQSLHIINISQDILEVKQRLNYVITTIKNSHSLLTILLGISSFFGKSGFTLEWLDDEHELIISSDGKFQELTEIISDCELFQQEIDSLLLRSKNLKLQAEQALINIEQENQSKQDAQNTAKLAPQFVEKKPQNFFIVGRSISLVASSLVVLGFGGWISKDKIPHFQQQSAIASQEASAVTNFTSALKLGTEASALVQSPPHPLIVWQQAKTKWQQAINLLTSVPEETSVAVKAKQKLIRYRINYNAISQKVLVEKKALADLESAHKLAIEAAFFVQTSPNSVLVWQQAKEKWQQAINLLEAIPASTAVSPQAKEMLASYKTNYAAISAIVKN